MTDLGLRWQKLRGLAGLDDMRIHDCRHTFASHAVMSGLDLYTVGRLLGHADETKLKGSSRVRRPVVAPKVLAMMRQAHDKIIIAAESSGAASAIHCRNSEAWVSWSAARRVDRRASVDLPPTRRRPGRPKPVAHLAWSSRCLQLSDHGRLRDCERRSGGVAPNAEITLHPSVM